MSAFVRAGGTVYVWVIDEEGNIGCNSLPIYSVRLTCNRYGNGVLRSLPNAYIYIQNHFSTNMTTMNWAFKGSIFTLESAGTESSSYEVSSIKLNGEDIAVGDQFEVTGNMEVYVYTRVKN